MSEILEKTDLVDEFSITETDEEEAVPHDKFGNYLINQISGVISFI